MKLSQNNTIVLSVEQEKGLFRMSVIHNNEESEWYPGIALEVFPNTTESELWDNDYWLEQLYLTLKAQMDYKERKIGYSNENEYVQEWFETFYNKGNIFEISDEFIDAWEDMQKLIQNEE